MNKNKNINNAIGYVRIANTKINPKALAYDSTINQVEGIVESAMVMGKDLKDIYVSTNNSDNLDKLFCELKKVKAKYLVVKSLDRLSRDPSKLYEFSKQLEKCNIELFVADEIFI